MGWGSGGVVAGLLALNAWLLWRVGVPFRELLQTLAAVVVLSLCGAALLGRLRPHFSDRPSFFAASFLLGSVSLVGLHYLLLGPFGDHLLAEPSIPFVSRLVMAVMTAVGIWGLWRARRSSSLPPAAGACVAAIAALAFGLAVASSYGHYNNMKGVGLRAADPPENGMRNWGWSADWRLHFGDRYRQLTSGELTPRLGLPMLGAGTIPFEQRGPWRSGKALILPFFFALLYLVYALATDALALSKGAALLSALSVALFAPLNATFLLGTMHSSYLGSLSAGGTLYHNTTQLMSFAIGMAAVYLLWLRLRDGAPAAPWAAVLIAGSFPFKPSFYTIAAPTFFLFVLLSHWRPPRVWRRDDLLGCAILLMVPVLYAVHWLTGGAFSFSRMDEPTGVPTQVGLALQPFHVLFELSQRLWPPGVKESPLLWAGLIVVTSLALPLCAALLYALSATRRGQHIVSQQLLSGRPARLFAAGCLVLCVLGLASGALFAVDDPRLVRNADLLWATGQGLMLALPLTIAVVAAVRWSVMRAFLWLLLGLHLASGTINLWRYVVDQSLV